MKLRIAAAFTSLFLAAVPAGAPAAGDPLRMTKEELKARLGDPTVSIIDARTPSEWRGGDAKIPGAVRGDPGDVGAWAEEHPRDRTLVVYCS
jgi:rhodanese-related sulfurtransferase